jgi:hypothetical protein
MVPFTGTALALAYRHCINRLWSSRSWWTLSKLPDRSGNELKEEEEDFLPLSKSHPMFSNFSTPFALEGLFGGFKLENDVSIPLFSTDIGVDPDRPGDNAHCDLALEREFTLLIAFFMLNFFELGELSNDTGTYESEARLADISLIYFEETSMPDFRELAEIFPVGGEPILPDSESKSKVSVKESDSGSEIFRYKSFSSTENLPGRIPEVVLDEDFPGSVNFSVYLIDPPILGLLFSLAWVLISFWFSNLLNSPELLCLLRKIPLMTSFPDFLSFFRSFSLSFPRWSPRVLEFLFGLEEDEEEVVVVDEGHSPRVNPESSRLLCCFRVLEEAELVLVVVMGLCPIGESDWLFGDGIPLSCEEAVEEGERYREVTSRDLALLGFGDWSKTTCSFSLFMVLN